MSNKKRQQKPKIRLDGLHGFVSHALHMTLNNNTGKIEKVRFSKILTSTIESYITDQISNNNNVENQFIIDLLKANDRLRKILTKIRKRHNELYLAIKERK